MSDSRRTKTSLIAAALLVLQGCALIDKVTGEGEAKRIRRIGHSAQATSPRGERYSAETKAVISRLHLSLVVPGSVLPVKVDPEDRTKVALDLYEEG
jgi:hypothetical protein